MSMLYILYIVVISYTFFICMVSRHIKNSSCSA